MHLFPRDGVQWLRAMVKCRLQEAFPWANRCIWMVQIQGVKEAHTHVLNDNFVREYTFDNLLDGLNCFSLRDNLGSMWCSKSRRTSMCCTDMHHLVVKEFCNFTQNEAVNLCRFPSWSYSCDCVAGLVELSGFQAMLDCNCQDASIACIQAYTTNKLLIAHLEASRQCWAFNVGNWHPP